MKKLLIKLIAITTLVTVGLPVGLNQAAQTAQANTQASTRQWQLFSPAGQGFSIRVPARPETIMSWNRKQPPNRHSCYQIGNTETGLYGMAVEETKRSLTMQESKDKLNKIIQNVLENHKRKENMQLLAHQSFTLGGYPGIELTWGNQSQLLKIRLFLVQNRSYLFTTVGPRKQAPQLDYFLQSFKFVNR